MHCENYQPEARPPQKISAIIPVWREHAALALTLPLLYGLPEVYEVIVCFAGADAALERMAADFGAKTVVAGAPSRGGQLDLGAELASGDWLLFHHVDSFLTAEHVRALSELTKDPRAIGGAFYRKFDERHPALRCLEPIERWHNRSFGALYGDQSIFARRDVFLELGGFRALPLMEDVDFSLRLRSRGKVVLLDPPLATSPRKHLAQGSWRTTFTNAAMLALYRLGVSPHRLHAWYYRAGSSAFPRAANYPEFLGGEPAIIPSTKS